MLSDPPGPRGGTLPTGELIAVMGAGLGLGVPAMACAAEAAVQGGARGPARVPSARRPVPEG